jgi:hypothetical protein
VQSAAQGEDPLTGIVQHLGSPIAAVRVTHAAGGAALAALAVAVAGIRINAWYGGTLGRTPEASTLLSGLSVSADVLALILPTSASARTYDPDRGKTTQVIQRGRLPTHEPLNSTIQGIRAGTRALRPLIKRRAYCRRCVLQRRKRYACLQWPYASERYDASQKLGEEVRASGGAGLIYDSLRRQAGVNVVAHRPRNITTLCRQIISKLRSWQRHARSTSANCRCDGTIDDLGDEPISPGFHRPRGSRSDPRSSHLPFYPAPSVSTIERLAPFPGGSLLRILAV